MHDDIILILQHTGIAQTDIKHLMKIEYYFKEPNITFVHLC